ncbi:hypothetical protein [Gilliamella sp. B2838]|uniref:hypothetical protein n=1 Tax=Gilliamella sp. B2838 TaxID=2818020 RepID=UPI0022698B3A|nr:hypothetical protein [Gilliamella sp. B2838]MCX8726966.1 hypothetical protein [Gilliamella sp. B2838]
MSKFIELTPSSYGEEMLFNTSFIISVCRMADPDDKDVHAQIVYLELDKKVEINVVETYEQIKSLLC